jgi:hypothetical protein
MRRTHKVPCVSDLRPEFVPHLVEWLREALGRGGQIAVRPHSVDGLDEWQIIVHNGQDAAGAEGTVLGVSGTQMDAELLAAGLWALL